MSILLGIFTILFNQYILLTLLLSLFSSTQSNYVIYLKIIGQGEINIINDTFIYSPSQVIVNGIANENCQKSCSLDNINYDYNNVTIIFNEQIKTCENMFNGLSDILKIDLSYFDTSQVTNMDSMFSGCTNLKNIIFNNINTSLVQNMRQLFNECHNLISLDLSNFDTSLVTNMNLMF